MTQRFAAARADAELLDRARAQYSHCLLCEHRCGVDRYGGERGKCKAGSELRLFRHRIEYGEEPELVPSHLFSSVRSRASAAAFSASQASTHLRPPGRGQLPTQEFFDTAVAWGQQLGGAKNIQWVGGEPTIHLPAILELMAAAAVLLPVVWKSDFYGTPAAFELLYDKVDVFVADFKFGNGNSPCEAFGRRRQLHGDHRTQPVPCRRPCQSDRAALAPAGPSRMLLPTDRAVDENALASAKFSVRDGFLPKWQAAKYEELSRPLAAGGRQWRCAADWQSKQA